MPKAKKQNKAVLAPNVMFATPKNSEGLMTYCESFSGPGEKMVAITCAMMGWNLAMKYIKEGYTLRPDED